MPATKISILTPIEMLFKRTRRRRWWGRWHFCGRVCLVDMVRCVMKDMLD